MNESHILIGCCGFPQAKKRYAQDFPIVEVQQTFYHLPTLQTAQRWRQEVPQDFHFTLKAWQLITHRATSPTYRRLKIEIPQEARDRYGFFQPTDEVFEAWDRTRQIAQALQAGMVVFQCPASFRPDQENLANMRSFFRTAERASLSFLWEPRGPWPADVIEGLCRQLDLVHVTDPFVGLPVHGEFNYFRLHGIGGYGYQYRDGDLETLLQICLTKSLTYCLFNNAFMYGDGLRFQELIRSRIP